MRKFLCILPLLVSQALWAQDDYIDLVWSDEFETDGAPDPANWTYDIGHGDNGWGNQEVQYYTNNAENVRVEGGKLIIEARKGNGGEWTSARVKSQGKKSFTYGRFVWKAKLPEGSGTWPALWMLGDNVTSVGWPASGEIDVMEHVGKWPGTVLSAIHTPSSFGDTQNKGTTQVSTLNSEFHTFELLWTPEKLVFYVDGDNYYTYNPTTKNASTWPFTNPFFIIMNIAMGGGLGSDPQYETGGLRNGIDPALSLARMEVEYVRVYQAFTELSLNGPSIVEKNQQGIEFSTNQLADATYEWSVPSGAAITSGQGTHKITVDWGETEGNVKVTVTRGQDVYEKELTVTHVAKPTGALFPLSSPHIDIEWSDVDNVNHYSVVDESGVTRIDYTVITPSTAPSLEGKLSRALDLTDHPVVVVRARSYNKSRTLRLRLDLVDENGATTNKPPVFNFEPLIDDGVFYDYRFDFSDRNGWQSEAGPVNASRITKINVYVDFGVFGSSGSDSLWIESIAVAADGQSWPLNRPSHLRGTLGNHAFSLRWNDNAEDEDGFAVYYALSSGGSFSELAAVEADVTSVDVPIAEIDPFECVFKVTGRKGDVESEFSNLFWFEDEVTSIESHFSRHVSVFPNPAYANTVSVDFPGGARVVIKLVDVNGVEYIRLQPSSNPAVLDISSLSPGLYLIHVSASTERTSKKLFVL